MEPTTLVAGLANYLGLGFTLDETQRDLLLRLTPSAFEDDRGSWGLALAEASYLKGDAAKVRFYAEEARKAIEEQVRMIPGDGQTHGNLGIALAYLGRKEEAMREGQKAVALSTGRGSGFFQGMLVEIYVLVGEPEKALDQLEPLLKVGADSVLSPGWLKVDPGFDPLRSNPRFQKLIASAN
jgi:tetratricopeptide (TPR) repeat protein